MVQLKSAFPFPPWLPLHAPHVPEQYRTAYALPVLEDCGQAGSVADEGEPEVKRWAVGWVGFSLIPPFTGCSS